MIEKEAFEEWKRNEITKLYFSALEKYRMTLLEAWAAGDFTSASVEGTAQLNAKALGQADILDRMKELDYDWISEYSK